MYKPEYMEDFEQESFEKEFGGYNDFPPLWRKITEQQFCNSLFFSHNPIAVEKRQMCRPKHNMREGITVEAWLYFFHDKTGIAIECYRPHQYQSYHLPEPSVHFYAFGCNHDYTELSYEQCKKEGIQHMGHCWHVWRCSKCGYVDAHDSSD